MYQDPYQPPNQPPYVPPGTPSSYGQPPYDQSSGQPPYGQTSYGQPPYDQSSGQPPYGQPPYNQPSYDPQPYMQYPTPTPRKRSSTLWIVLSIIGGLIVLSCIGCAVFGVFISKQTANVTQTIQKTATALDTHGSYLSSLSGNGPQAFVDPLSQESGSQWASSPTDSSGGACQFNAGAYHVSQQTKGYLMDCFANGTFSNFAFEVQLTITQGDCGGMVFRHDDNGNFYLFSICQDGKYVVSKYANHSDATDLDSGSSPAINTGTGQQNKIAVVASGDTMTFYVNEQQITQQQDSSYTSGSLGLTADPESDNPTDVAYTNATLWTR